MFSVVSAVFHQATATNCTSQSKSCTFNCSASGKLVWAGVNVHGEGGEGGGGREEERGKGGQGGRKEKEEEIEEVREDCSLS